MSRVLTGGVNVSAAAYAAVTDAIERVGYVPNRAARNLTTNRAGAAALVIQEPQAQFLEDPIIGTILLGANSELSAADVQLVMLILDSPRDRDRASAFITGGFVDGALLVSTRAADPVVEAISRAGVPLATIGRSSRSTDIPYATIDNRRAAREITQRLRQTGRKRIGMIASGLDRDSGRDRRRGFRQALGDGYDPALVFESPYYTYQAGLDGIGELLRREPELDGVFASSDAAASGVIDGLLAAGRSVPGDVGVVGFDDSSWALRAQRPLSTVRQPAYELGQVGARIVLDQLAGKGKSDLSVVLPTTVVWRESA